MRLAAIALLVAAPALADSTPPPSKGETCERVSPALAAEARRMLASAARHATQSEACVDGSGKVTEVRVGAVCKEGGALRVTYDVTTTFERGGECTPSPDCGRSDVEHQHIVARFAVRSASGGVALVVPREVPAMVLYTAIDKPHHTSCYGDEPAFVAKTISK